MVVVKDNCEAMAGGNPALNRRIENGISDRIKSRHKKIATDLQVTTLFIIM